VWPLLLAAQWLHIGKGTIIGMGQLMILAPGCPPPFLSKTRVELLLKIVTCNHPFDELAEVLGPRRLTGAILYRLLISGFLIL